MYYIDLNASLIIIFEPSNRLLLLTKNKSICLYFCKRLNFSFILELIKSNYFK